MADPTCETCPFFALATVAKGHLYNACRRRPPDAVLTIADHAWPQVDPDDVCGEHPLHPAQRDRLAAMAMQAQLHSALDAGQGWNDSEIARHAYDTADAMLAERAKAATSTPTTKED
jgi:hypothetical protein